jgi:hypothetical protein
MTTLTPRLSVYLFPRMLPAGLYANFVLVKP